MPMKYLYNAKVLTFNPNSPIASAVVIDGKHIYAVGENEVKDLGGRNIESEDMHGRTIIPGLTDSHLHLQDYSLSITIIHCEGISKEECLEKVRDQASRSPAGGWIRGHGWNQNDWGGEWPTRRELDEASLGLPVYLTAKSLHAGWASKKALELAGIQSGSPDPENGRILRDESGMPSGILLEEAMKIVEREIPEPDPLVLADIFQKETIPTLWRLGITGVHDFDKRTCLRALQILHERNQLNFRVNKSIPYEDFQSAINLGVGTGFGDDTLRLGSLKLFADGALGPHTGALFEPYEDDPKNFGILKLKSEDIFEIGCKAAEVGISLAVHAIGDRASQEVLDGLEKLRDHERQNNLPALRHRIEHVQTIHPEDAKRFSQLNIIASMQPSHAISDMEIADLFLGKRSSTSYAWKMQLENSSRLIFGSDAPVEEPNPFHGIHAAITRRRLDGYPGKEGWFPEQRIGLKETIEAYTITPAYAAGLEHVLGRISPGYLADLIVMEDDPFTVETDSIYNLAPIATMVGGVWVWRA